VGFLFDPWARCPVTSFRSSLGSEPALFSWLDLGTQALAGDPLTSKLLLLLHVA